MSGYIVEIKRVRTTNIPMTDVGNRFTSIIKFASKERHITFMEAFFNELNKEVELTTGSSFWTPVGAEKMPCAKTAKTVRRSRSFILMRYRDVYW